MFNDMGKREEIDSLLLNITRSKNRLKELGFIVDEKREASVVWSLNDGTVSKQPTLFTNPKDIPFTI